jgi:hypothetical protein
LMATTPLKPETIPQKLITMNTDNKQKGTSAISRYSCHGIHKLESVLLCFVYGFIESGS